MVRLRQKLDQYTAEHENRDSFRIVIPKGDYVVRFEPNPGFNEDRNVAKPAFAVAESKLTDALLISSTAAPEPVSGRVWGPPIAPFRLTHWLIIGLLSVLCVLLASLLFFRRTESVSPVSTHNPLWSVLFQKGRPTLSVSADSGLVVMENMTGQEITLAEYLNRDFSRLLRGLPPDKQAFALGLGSRRYTAFTDVISAISLSNIAAAYHSFLVPKYSRDLNINDLKQNNLILGGAHLSTPWLELFEPNMDFVGVNDVAVHGFRFDNKHPHGKELSSYAVSWKDAKQQVIGLVAFLPGLTDKSNVLIIEGSNVAGGEAVDDFLLDDKSLMPFLNSIKQPNGTMPYFEAILGSTSVNGNAGPVHVVVYHTHPR